MPSRSTPRLKLHTEDLSPESTAAPRQPYELNALVESVGTAIGWRLAINAAREGSSAEPPAVQLAPAADQEQRVRRGQAEQVAQRIGQVAARIDQLQHLLTEREAELASVTPMRAQSLEESHLAERLIATIQGGAEAIGCDAAAIYILNDATDLLKLRCAWRLPPERLAEPPRELAPALADLEALVGHAVVIEDTNDGLPWQSPEPGFGAALCVPIATPNTPLGTLWFFDHRPRPFSDEETNVAEIVAGRVAAELERTALLDRSAASDEVEKQLHRAGDWFNQRLPHIEPLTAQWQFAGDRLDSSPGGDFFDWGVQPDGRLRCIVADCAGYNIDSLLSAAALHAAMLSHLSYRQPPGRLLRRLNDTVWSSSPGGASSSIFLAMIDEDTGAMEYAWAGEPLVIAVRDGKYRSLVEPATPLGEEPDATIPQKRRRIAADEIVIALTESVRHAPLRKGGRLDEAALAAAVRPWAALDADQLQTRLARWIDQQVESPAAAKTSMLILRRRPK